MKKIKVIGGGIFGCCIASELAKCGHEVVLIERDSDIMQRASKQNHNRVHFGFHYPRSVPTAKQSLDGLVSFLINFKDSIVSGFPNYYMNHKNSNVSSEEYINFCNAVGLNYDFKYPKDYLVDKREIDLSIKVNECIFDYDILKSIVKGKLKGVDVRLNTDFDGSLDGYDYVINAAYSNINEINDMLGAPKLKLKFQDVIIPIFKMNHKKIGLTIMDGPFCSIMPRGNNENEFLLYHPKYSVISQHSKSTDISRDRVLDSQKTNLLIKKIYKESEKFYPVLSSAEQRNHWRTVRALPVNNDDARMSEVFVHEETPNVINVFGGKISTCWKVASQVKSIIRNGVQKEVAV